MDISSFNWFDIGIIVVLLLSVVLGVLRGFIQTIFTLFAWCSAIAITILLYHPTSSFLNDKIDNERVVMVIAALGVFIVSFVILAIAAGRIIDILKAQQIGLLDRSLGFALGVVRAVFLVSIIFVSITLVTKMMVIKDDYEGPEWFVKAQSYNSLKVISDTLLELLPESVMKKLKGDLSDLSQYVKKGAMDQIIPIEVEESDKESLSALNLYGEKSGVNKGAGEELLSRAKLYMPDNAEFLDDEQALLVTQMMGEFSSQDLGKLVMDSNSKQEFYANLIQEYEELNGVDVDADKMRSLKESVKQTPAEEGAEVINDNLYFSNNSAGRNDAAISTEDTQTMRQIMLIMSDSDIEKVYESYEDPILIYRKIVELYEVRLEMGKIAKENEIDQERLISLKEALAPPPVSVPPIKDLIKKLDNKDTTPNGKNQDVGYKKNNIEQLNRLMNSY